MQSIFCSAEQWAQEQFGAVRLGDRRRTRRLVKVAGRLAECPSGTLPGAMGPWNELKGAYRLFSNRHVSYSTIIQEHCQQTLRECCQAGEYLLIEDRSCLDYSSHRATQGLGRIGNDRGAGFLLHTTLAVRVEEGVAAAPLQVVGLLGQSCWARKGTSARAKKERWRQRLSRPRESERWAEALSRLPRVPESVRWIYVADRESDIYEVFERCAGAGVDFIVRAQFARALAKEDRSVFEAVKAVAAIGRFELELRTRPDALARTVKLEVRSCRVSLRGVWRPGGNRPDYELNVVEIREETADEPIHWVLLTSLPCEKLEQARRIATCYARRWLIEEYHKALKSGTHVEASQLESAQALQSLLGILAVAAVRLLNMKLWANSQPQQKIHPQAVGAEELSLLTAEFGEPPGGWTYGNTLVAIARMGGFLARKSDGSPGWITIWRGWQRLNTMAQGIRSFLLKNYPKHCG
jgi:Transposase DNA-binding/Transposase DDE domain